MKSIFASKTVWVNVLAIVVLAVQHLSGAHVINAEVAATVIAVLNFLLRLVTNQGVSWGAAR